MKKTKNEKDELLNGSAGYGSMANLIRMKRVYMTEHTEGVGTKQSPMRQVLTFFDEDGNVLARKDPCKTQSNQNE